MSHKHWSLSDPVNHLWTSLCLWIDLMKWPNSSPAKVHHTQFSILPILPVYLPDIPRTDFWIFDISNRCLKCIFLFEMNSNALLVRSVPISNGFLKQIGPNPDKTLLRWGGPCTDKGREFRSPNSRYVRGNLNKDVAERQ